MKISRAVRVRGGVESEAGGRSIERRGVRFAGLHFVGVVEAV